MIRHATADDLSSLHKLMFELHNEHHQAEPDHFKSANQVMAEKDIKQYIDAPDAFVFVSVFEQGVVGFATGHFGEFESSISQPVMMGSIDELYVYPESRNHGIGSDLLTRCAQEFEDYGVKQVMVEVWDFNQVAIKLYRSLGYQAHIHCLRKILD